MKRTGPPGTPSHLRILRGNPGRRPINDQEAHPEAKIPPCPSHLDDEAKKEWRSISKQLLELGLLTKIDKAALAGYCVAWSSWIEALEQLKAGKVFKTPSGYPVLSPWWAIATQADKQMHRYLTEFGLTPASRSRIHVQPPKKEESKLAKFIGGKAG